MATYDWLINSLGLTDWCEANKSDGPMTMAELLAKNSKAPVGEGAGAVSFWELPFPSLDELNKSCSGLARTRDMTSWVEDLFLAVKDSLKLVLDPITQPLSWALDGSLWLFTTLPWFVVIPLLLLAVWAATRSWALIGFVALSFGGLAFIDHYVPAIQTLSIIFVCTSFSVIIGVPIGILLSRSDTLQKISLPVLDMLQTLPTFVYLIPLIFLFSVTESKLYGVAIILYAVVPVIRLTDLGIRLVDKDVIEAANAFGMTEKQKLFGVQIPLALPTIMAGTRRS